MLMDLVFQYVPLELHVLVQAQGEPYYYGIILSLYPENLFR